MQFYWSVVSYISVHDLECGLGTVSYNNHVLANICEMKFVISQKTSPSQIYICNYFLFVHILYMILQRLACLVHSYALMLHCTACILSYLVPCPTISRLSRLRPEQKDTLCYVSPCCIAMFLPPSPSMSRDICYICAHSLQN